MIRLSGLAQYFNRGDVNQVLAIDNLSLDIEKGDFITVIGSNGAGKSTLLNLLAGAFPPDAGSILLDGVDIARWPEHRRAVFIGRVFQDPLLGTCGGLRIDQNLSIAARRGRRRGLSIGVKKADRQRFRDELARLDLGLENRLRDKVGLLSGGQRQALTLLMATLQTPRLLLLDEHTAALDPKTARQILSLTRSLVTESDLTTLMVTHNMRQAIEFGNRLIMLHRGRIIFDARGEQKAALTVNDLVERFYNAGGEGSASDRMLLA